MSGVWQENIVRLCSSGGGEEALGTGTLVATRQDGLCVLTCAHVLNAALGRGEYAPERPDDDAVFVFDLPARSRGRKYRAKLLEWWPPLFPVQRIAQPVGDIALLKIVSADIPQSVRPWSVDDFIVDELQDRLVRSFGFARPGGEFAAGRLLGEDVSGWMHFAAESAQGPFVAPGFSGAPLFDDERRFILGMVAAVDEDEDKRVAYALATQLIWTACPQLARPYRGLRDFGERDRAFFFGRKVFVGRLCEKLKSHPIVGVAGASGSGKSSVVKAGLIPELRKERDWTILKMRPAADPWAELARELIPLLHEGLSLGDRLGKEEELTQKLRADPSHLGDCLRGIARAKRSGLVLVFVDQFEELFTQAGHEAGEADQTAGVEKPPDFRDLMLRTASLKGSPSIQWLYTLRADFAGQAYRHPAFVEALGDGEEKLADMNATELRQSIVEPARKLEVDFEAGRDGGPSVSERIADAVEARPGSLPLMAHLLEKLWEKLERRQVTHDAYDGLGGLEGALNRHADEVYEALTAERKLLARRLFSRLVKIEEGNEPTRRVRTRDELGEELWQVAGLLADADSRLLVIRGTGEAMQEAAEFEDTAAQARRQTTEVAHEALLRNWGRFRGWLKEDLAFLLWRQRLEQRMDEYQRYGRSANQLLREEALAEANGWSGAPSGEDLTSSQKDYIELSNKKAEEEAKQRASAAKERIALLTRQRRWALAALALAIAAVVLIFVASALGVRTVSSEQRLASERRLKNWLDAARVAEQSIDLANRGYLIEATKKALEIENAVENLEDIALDGHPIHRAILSSRLRTNEFRLPIDANPLAVSYHPELSTIIVTSDDDEHSVQIWDLVTLQMRSVFRGAFEMSGYTVDPVRGELYIIEKHSNLVTQLAVSDGGKVNQFSLNNFTKLDQFDYVPSIGMLIASSQERGIAYDPTLKKTTHLNSDQLKYVRQRYARQIDRGKLAGLQLTETKKNSDVTGRAQHIIAGRKDVSFQPYCPIAATGGNDGLLRIWDVGDEITLKFTASVDDRIYAVFISPRCDVIAIEGEKSGVRLYDVSTRRFSAAMRHFHVEQLYGFDFTGSAIVARTGREVVVAPVRSDVSPGGVTRRGIIDFRPTGREILLQMSPSGSSDREALGPLDPTDREPTIQDAVQRKVSFISIDAKTGAEKCELNGFAFDKAYTGDITLVSGGAGCEYFLAATRTELYEVTRSADTLEYELLWKKIWTLPANFDTWPSFWSMSRAEISTGLLLLPTTDKWSLLSRSVGKDGVSWKEAPVDIVATIDLDSLHEAKYFTFVEKTSDGRLLVLGDDYQTYVVDLKERRPIWVRKATVGCKNRTIQSRVGAYLIQEYGDEEQCQRKVFMLTPETLNVSQAVFGFQVMGSQSENYLIVESNGKLSVHEIKGLKKVCEIVTPAEGIVYYTPGPGPISYLNDATISEGSFLFSPGWHNTADKWKLLIMEEASAIVAARGVQLRKWSLKNCEEMRGGDLQLSNGEDAIVGMVGAGGKRLLLRMAMGMDFRFGLLRHQRRSSELLPRVRSGR
ncbi:trypsin-like peptidase domain-containing protein (plasmid) [Sinorhizobium meliloti]